MFLEFIGKFSLFTYGIFCKFAYHLHLFCCLAAAICAHLWYFLHIPTSHCHETVL